MAKPTRSRLPRTPQTLWGPSRMRRCVVVAALVAGVTALAGCSKFENKKADAPPPSAEKMRDVPDFGGVTKAYVEVEGVGPTRAAAIDDALRLAIKQVNGIAIDASQAQLSIATGIATSQGDVAIDAAGFAEAVATQSKGVVSDFKIIKETEAKPPFLGLLGKGDARGSWRVRIGANIAKYRASADANRPRLVVAPARGGRGSFAFGDGERPASAMSAAIQTRLSNAIAQTNRFVVVDRQATDEIQNELDLMGSGAINPQDTVRVGQQLAADLIVIPTIERMEYVRHARQLRLSDRQLVSYSGGARILFRVVNATTGQLVLSDTFATEFPTTRPTTLGASVDANGATNRALADMTDQFVAKLLQKTFPVSVISMTGSDVVLSQGGAAVRQGAVYRAVLLGEPLKDPQTGQSLGRTEQNFGTVEVTRSEANMAYGLLRTASSLPGGFRPGLIELREEVRSTPVVQFPFATRPAQRASEPVPQRRAAAAQTSVAEDKNW